MVNNNYLLFMAHRVRNMALLIFAGAAFNTAFHLYCPIASLNYNSTNSSTGTMTSFFAFLPDA